MLAWPPRERISVRRVRSWTRRRLWPRAALGDQTSCRVMDSPSARRTATGSASSFTGAATWAGVTVSLCLHGLMGNNNENVVCMMAKKGSICWPCSKGRGAGHFL